MGIFDIFRKKKQDDDAPCESILDESVQDTPEQPAKEAAAPKTADPDVVPDVHTMLAIIKEQYPDAEWQGDSGLQFPCGLELKISLGSLDTFPKGICAQLLFVMWHPFFDEDLVESVAGMGKTEAAAKYDGLDSFRNGVLPHILDPLENLGSRTIRAKLQGKSRLFHEPTMLGTIHRGEGQPVNLWSLIRKEIPNYLGTKKVYWIKLLSSRMGKDICEARINGMVFHDLTDKLYDAIHAGKSTVQGGMDKMFILLIQDDESYTPCPYTKAEAASIATKALHRMLTITDEESHRAVFEEIQQMHPTLGGEACAFLPVIFSHILFRYHASDSVIPINVDVGELRKSQLRSFGYFESAVLDYLRKERPDGDERMKILRLSAEFDAIHQAMQDGSRMEDLVISPLAYLVPEDYIIY